MRQRTVIKIMKDIGILICGTSEPSTANLMALAKLYALSVDELLSPGE